MATKTEQCLIRMEEKLDHVYNKVQQNSTDIKELQKDINQGKGSIKLLVWIGSVVGVIIGFFKYGGNP